ncbi:hypothetical protein SH501x_002132 [Pirellulaceae bacterium SH501]
MATEEEIERAVEQERARCLELLMFYREAFDKSSDEMIGHLWCRIYNQVSMGVEAKDAGFQQQFFDDEDWDEDEEGLVDEEDWDEDGDSSLRVDKPH